MSASPEWEALKEGFPDLRLRVNRDVRVGESNLLCRVPIGPDYPLRVVPAGSILRFDRVSHGAEYACAWIGPPAPVFAVEGGPTAGYLLAFYLEWLRPPDLDLAMAIEELTIPREDRE